MPLHLSHPRRFITKTTQKSLKRIKLLWHGLEKYLAPQGLNSRKKKSTYFLSEERTAANFRPDIFENIRAKHLEMSTPQSGVRNIKEFKQILLRKKKEWKKDIA